MEVPFKILAFVCIAFCGCSFLSPQENENVHCYKITNLFPKFDNSGMVREYDTSFAKVYFYGNFRLYDLSYIFKYNDVVNGEVFQRRRHLVAFNKDSLYGIDYDEFKIPAQRRVRLDSLFRNEWVAQNKVYPILGANISTLISKESNVEKQEVTETYSLQSREDSSLVGTVSLVFKKEFARKIDISLSKELDSIKGMKLVKTEIKVLAKDFKQYKTHIGKYVTGNELSEIPVEDVKKIKSYFLK